MEIKKFCPFCGSEDIELEGTAIWHCNECDRLFDYDEWEHEVLRQKISSICSAFEATEENPINCIREDAMELHVEGIFEEAQGLSEAEKPQIATVFQSNDIVFVTLTEEFTLAEGELNPNNEPIELDMFITVSLRQILDWLEENLSIKALGRIN